MANTTKTRKPMTTQQKGLICLAVLLVATILVSFFALVTRSSGDNGMYEHRSWVPVSSANWPDSLPVTRALGGGTAIDYDYTVADDAQETAVEDSVKAIRQRLNEQSEYDVAVSAAGGKLHMELRDMTASKLSSLISASTRAAQFVFADASGNQVLTEKEIKHAEAEVNRPYSNSNYYTIYLNFEATEEGKQALEAAGAKSLTVTMDGESVSTSASVDGGKISAYMGTDDNAYLTATSLAYWINTGAVDMALTNEAQSELKATSGSVLTVALIAGALLLVCSLVYMVMKGKLTGVAGFLGVWCALVVSLFFVASIVVPTVTVLNTGCLIAVLLGVLLAVDASVTRTEAIAKQVKDGAAVKQASKLGFSTTRKNVWMLHGIVLLVSLVLMIFSFSKSTGYCLACGVVGSAVGIIVMRAYQYCLNMVTSKPSLYGANK